MSSFRVVRQCLHLLRRRDQHRLVLVTVVQIFTSLLDLIGVLLIGLVGALAVTIVQSQPPPSVVTQIAGALGLQDAPSQSLLTVFAVAAATVLLLKSGLSSLLLRRVFIFLARRQAQVSAQLAKGLLAQPLTFVQQRSSQETSFAIVQGAGVVTILVLGQAVIVVTELSLMIVLGVTLLLVSPAIAIASIAFFALVAVVLQLALGKWASRSGLKSATADIASLDTVQEVLNAYREVTVANRRHHYVDRIESLRWQAASVGADLQFIMTLPKYVFEVALVIGGFALAGVLFTTTDAAESVGLLALFLAAATRVMPSILRLQGAALGLRNASGLAQPTLQLAEELRNPLTSEPAQVDLTELHGRILRSHDDFEPSIALEAVSFRYPGASDSAISGMNFFMEPGSSAGLVGTSGAGKSTLADLILGVLPPTSGRIAIGGLKPAEAIARWPGAIAYVPQDVVLANASVRSNVALGLPTEAIDDDLVWEALDRSHLSEMLRGERDGLDTLIGERGVKLSGGQRQRLGIARALYTRPRLVVLDEATSALDAETEMAISSTLQELEGSVTIVYIAHRLSTVREVDQILFLEAGRAVAIGSFSEVRQAVPAFDRQATIMGLA